MRRNDKDFLDELIEERERREPGFRALVDDAYRRRILLRRLAAERERAGVSQTEVAARMNTSQSAVARLERGEIDAKLSTVYRLAAAVGKSVEWRIVTRRSTSRPRSRSRARAQAKR